MRFIDNKPENGIEINWREVKKIYDSLDIPPEYANIPWNAIYDLAKYFLSMSRRSTGKTNDWLLLGLCLNKWSIGRIQTAYIRMTEDELSQSHAEKLVEVINTYRDGHYINKLTDGRYNCLVWHWRQFYYAHRGDDGKVDDRAEQPVIQCLSVDRAMDYKSTLNMPYGELLILDEAIGKRYRPDDAVRFLDLTKTIIRSRQSPIIGVLCNTLSDVVTSPFFEELEVSKDVKKLRSGEHKIIDTPRGTRIYMELLEPETTKQGQARKSLVNRLFYGFNNPKLASITGGELFAFEAVPHILYDAEGRRVIAKNVYIDELGELLQIEFCYNDIQGYHLEVHRATRTYDDSIILSLRDVHDSRYRFGLGTPLVEKQINNAIYDRRVYFSSNEVGAIFYGYIDRVFLERRKH